MVQNINVCIPKDCFERPLLTYVDTLPEASEAIKDTIYVVNDTNRWYIVNDTPEFVEVATGSGGGEAIPTVIRSSDGSVIITHTTTSSASTYDLSVMSDVISTAELRTAYYGL